MAERAARGCAGSSWAWFGGPRDGPCRRRGGFLALPEERLGREGLPRGHALIPLPRWRDDLLSAGDKVY